MNGDTSMNILIINCGSSSLKYQLINGTNEVVLAKGLCDRIGLESSSITHQPIDKEKVTTELPIKNHTDAVQFALDKLIDQTVGVIASLDEINAIGHRIVHGGEKFVHSVLVTEEVVTELEDCIDLAPLHTPGHLSGIRSCLALMPTIPNVLVFDTAFHQTMPEKAYLYGLPYEYYEKHQVRRYGFHGTSHDFVSERAAQMIEKDRKDLKIIVCHLGNGASISAVDQGQCVDTSMGLTPLAGLIMGTRCGDMDPAIVEYICKKEQITVEEMLSICNKKSGVLGLSNGFSSDFRDLAEAAESGNAFAQTALEAYAYRIGKYIGSYVAAMGGIDIIAFTAGAGENNAAVRSLVGQYLTYFGTNIDPERNKSRGEEIILSDEGSRVVTMVVPTNEELAIARETKLVLNL